LCYKISPEAFAENCEGEGKILFGLASNSPALKVGVSHPLAMHITFPDI
jgi:hypothetical protein